MQKPPEGILRNDESVEVSTRDTIPQKKRLLHSECTEHPRVPETAATEREHSPPGGFAFPTTAASMELTGPQVGQQRMA
jgi:hypothetical protein